MPPRLDPRRPNTPLPIDRPSQPPWLPKDLPKIALESSPWPYRSAAVPGPDAPTFTSEMPRRNRLSLTFSTLARAGSLRP